MSHRTPCEGSEVKGERSSQNADEHLHFTAASNVVSTELLPQRACRHLQLISFCCFKVFMCIAIYVYIQHFMFCNRDVKSPVFFLKTIQAIFTFSWPPLTYFSLLTTYSSHTTYMFIGGFGLGQFQCRFAFCTSLFCNLKS